RVLAASTATVTLSAAVARGESPSRVLRMARRAAPQLAAAGRPLDALRLRLLLARAATADGALSTAERELAAALPLARRGNLSDRIALQYVSAMTHLRRGDNRAARRALKAGLRLLEDRRATFGSIELRAAVSALGEELC